MGIIKNLLDKIAKPKPHKVEEVTKECDLLITKARKYKQRVHNTKGAFGKPKFKREVE